MNKKLLNEILSLSNNTGVKSGYNYEENTVNVGGKIMT